MTSTINRILCLAGALSAFSVAASAAPLSGSEIKALVSGKKVYLATPYGAEFPLHYRKNGNVTGDASGFSLASFLAPKETGKWWTQGQKLCQKWPTWYKGKTICFTIQQTGDNSIAWVRDDGMKGTARISN
jgi:hypothetical protein